MMRAVLRLAGWLGLGWVIWRILGPEPAPDFPENQERPLGVAGRTVRVGRHEFFVREAGDGAAPPIVLVHGWSFDGEMTFHGIVPGLAERFRVLMIDHRGHGKSDRIRGRYDVEDLADELAAVLTALEVGPVTVVGYSLGGMVAQALAARHPTLVARMVLAATAARPVDRARPLVKFAFLVGRSIARISSVEMSFITYRLLVGRGIVDERHRAWLWENLRHRDATLYYEAGFAAWRFDSRSWVGDVRIPTLVIITTADQIVPSRTQYDLAAHVHEPDVVELVGARHESILDRPDEYVKLITDFATRA